MSKKVFKYAIKVMYDKDKITDVRILNSAQKVVVEPQKVCQAFI